MKFKDITFKLLVRINMVKEIMVDVYIYSHRF